jgi:ankyrin repeat protein
MPEFIFSMTSFRKPVRIFPSLSFALVAVLPIISLGIAPSYSYTLPYVTLLSQDKGKQTKASETTRKPTGDKQAVKSSGAEELLDAIIKKDVARVHALLESGGDPNGQDEDGQPLLFRAAEIGSAEICTDLLKHGAKLAAPPKISPVLTYAVVGGNIAVIKLFLEYGEDANGKDKLGDTPLTYAATKHSVDMMALLVEKGARVDAVADDGDTALHSAVTATGIRALLAANAQANEKDKVTHAINTVKFLLDHGANINAKGKEKRTPLMLAVMGDEGELADLLIKRGADVNAKDRIGKTALMLARGEQSEKMSALLRAAGAKDFQPTLLEAVLQSDSATVRKLLAAGEDANQVDSDGRTPLHYAVSESTEPIVMALISKGANPNAVDHKGVSVIKMATVHTVVDLLRDAGAESPDADLFDALTAKDMRAFERALGAGANVNAMNEVGVSILYTAVSQGNKQAVRILLDKGANVNTPKGEDFTPLMEAAGDGYIEIVKTLIEHGAEVNAATTTGETAALLSTNDDVLKLLLAKGANPRAKTENGTTMLMAAVTAGSVETINYVLNHGGAADIDPSNMQEETALMRAASSGNADAVKLLLERGADPNRVEKHRGATALRMVVESMVQGRSRAGLQVVRLLLAHHADPNLAGKDDLGKQTGAPINIAIDAGLSDVADILRKAGAKRSASKPVNSLAQAVYVGDIDTVRSLIKKRVDLNARDEDGSTPLLIAVTRRYSDIARLLLASGAKPDIASRYGAGSDAFEGGTPLSEASGSGDIATMKLLLKAGANPNHGTSLYMPLREAAEKGNIEACRLLLDSGANVKAGEKTGDSALYKAVGARSSTQGRLVRLLIARGANVNETTENGETPLMRAAELGNDEIVKLLLESGANPKAATSWGRTVLMQAALSGGVEMVQLLMSKGVDINAKDDRNSTALSLAQDRGYNAVIELLIRAGAKQ